jgi:hypothetical protein
MLDGEVAVPVVIPKSPRLFNPAQQIRRGNDGHEDTGGLS